jgi:lipopolysaccharide heptosyltransferase II
MAPPVEPKKILIVLHGSIGDVTRALPLARLVRGKYPKAFLAWSVEPACLPLLEHCAAIDEVILFDRSSSTSSVWPFLKKIRAQRFDVVLDLQRHLKSGLISLWSGAPYRLGFHRSDAKEFNWLFNNHHVAAGADRLAKIDHYLKFAEHLGISPAPVGWQIELTPRDKLNVRKYLAGIVGDFAVLFVGSRWQSKDWFADQIASCAGELIRRHDLSVVLLGGRADESVAREVVSLVSENVFDLVGRTSLREAVGIIARAKMCIGPDTGLMHLAAAVGTPVISLWGATDPQRTGPYGFEALAIKGQADCSPCYRKSCPIGRVCMRSITPDAIVEKIKLALAHKPKPVLAHVEGN